MKIESTAFGQNGKIPTKYTCDGNNISPPLAFSGIPKKAKSLALIVDDPDAPMGLWVHWLMWNITPDTLTIGEGNIPRESVEGTTSYLATHYGGPCPPDREHRYFFKLYALDVELELPKESVKEQLEEAMMEHVLDKAELIGLYNRIQNE